MTETRTLAEKAREIKELKIMADELNAEIAALEDEIKATMTEQQADEIIAGAYTIRWKAVKSTRFDVTALKKAMPELYDRFSKTAESRRFSIA